MAEEDLDESERLRRGDELVAEEVLAEQVPFGQTFRVVFLESFFGQTLNFDFIEFEVALPNFGGLASSKFARRGAAGG